jgi:hypothetical protein
MKSLKFKYYTGDEEDWYSGEGWDVTGSNGFGALILKVGKNKYEISVDTEGGRFVMLKTEKTFSAAKKSLENYYLYGGKTYEPEGVFYL